MKQGADWHTYHTNHVRPPKYTSLYAVSLPSSGGDTAVVNMRAGYEALSDEVRQKIQGMKTVNVFQGSSSARYSGQSADAQGEKKPQPVLQPLVRTHPDNGTKALYFHPVKAENIVGMGSAESQALLRDLLEHSVRPDFIYRHQWRKGDMLIWDNRAAMHRASFDYDPNEYRLLYRVLVRGAAGTGARLLGVGAAACAACCASRWNGSALSGVAKTVSSVLTGPVQRYSLVRTWAIFMGTQFRVRTKEPQDGN